MTLDLKKGFGVFGGDFSDFFWSGIEIFGEEVGDVFNQCGVVLFATVWFWREEGRVGFEHNAI